MKYVMMYALRPTFLSVHIQAAFISELCSHAGYKNQSHVAHISYSTDVPLKSVILFLFLNGSQRFNHIDQEWNQSRIVNILFWVRYYISHVIPVAVPPVPEQSSLEQWTVIHCCVMLFHSVHINYFNKIFYTYVLISHRHILPLRRLPFLLLHSFSSSFCSSTFSSQLYSSSPYSLAPSSLPPSLPLFLIHIINVFLFLLFLPIILFLLLLSFSSSLYPFLSSLSSSWFLLYLW